MFSQAHHSSLNSLDYDSTLERRLLKEGTKERIWNIEENLFYFMMMVMRRQWQPWWRYVCKADCVLCCVHTLLMGDNDMEIHLHLSFSPNTTTNYHNNNLCLCNNNIYTFNHCHHCCVGIGTNTSQVKRRSLSLAYIHQIFFVSVIPTDSQWWYYVLQTYEQQTCLVTVSYCI